MQKQDQLLTQPMGGLFLRYLIPGVLGMLAMSAYILADTFFVANGVGANGLAALNVALPVYALISSIALMIGVGGATLFSVSKGKNDVARRDSVFTVCMICGILIGVCIMLVCIFGAEVVAKLLGASEQTGELAVTYIRTIGMFTPAFMLNTILVSFVRNDREPALAMTAVIISSLSNVVFDYIFIFPLGWGMFGAAFATGFSPVISLLILSSHFWRKKNTFSLQKIRRSKFALLPEIVSGGVGSFITELSGGVVIVLFNLTLGKMTGDLGIAAYGIIANIALVCTAVFTGIGQAIQPIVSINYGAGLRSREKRVLYYGLLAAALFGVLFYLLGFFYPAEICSAFNKENLPELTRLTVQGMRLYFIGFLFAGSNIVFSMFFQSVCQTRASVVVSFGRGFAMIAAGLLLLPPLFGLDGLWMVVPTAEITLFVVSLLLFAVYHRKSGEQSY